MQLKPWKPVNPLARCLFAAGSAWLALVLGGAICVEFGYMVDGLPESWTRLLWLENGRGLFTWSKVVAVSCAGLACLIMGTRQRRLSWWLGGGFLMLLSIDELIGLGQRLEQVLIRGAWLERPGIGLGVLGLALVASLAIWGAWRAARGIRFVQRRMLQAVFVGALGLILDAAWARWGASMPQLDAVDLERVLPFVTGACSLLAPLLLLYAIVSLLEWNTRQARIDERNRMRLSLQQVHAKRAA